MQWQLEGVNIKPSDSLRQYAEQRVREPLSNMTSWVRQVTLRLRDTDLGSLESGRHVKAVVHLANGSTMSVDQPTRDFYAGIDLLAGRLKRLIRRRHERRRRSKSSRRGRGGRV